MVPSPTTGLIPAVQHFAHDEAYQFSQTHQEKNIEEKKDQNESSN